MSKQAIIAIVIAAIIILGAAGAFLYSQNKLSNKASNTTVSSEVTKSPKNGMTQSTISEIFASGKNAKCTFTVGADEGQTSGTVYTSGENARGDFTTTVDNKESETHMIKDGDTFYMWGDTLSTGIKMVMKINELSSKLGGDENYSSINPDQQMDVNCVNWTQDATLFTPPTNIRFISIDTMMPTGTAAKASGTPTSAADTSGTSNQCSICNSLSGQAKSTCLAQFNCQ